MKNFIVNFKNFVKYSVSIIASREFAFIYCSIGTIAQISHTYFLINNISSLDGYFKILQALMLSVFISSSLLYFTAISDNENTKESRKIHMAVTLFTVIEILINIYYYSRHLLIDNLNNITINYIFDFIFAVIISCLIPVTIKLYSSHIRAKEWLAEIFSDEEISTNSGVISDEERQLLIDGFNESLNEIRESINKLESNQLSDEKLSEIKTNLINDLTTESDRLKQSVIGDFEKSSKLFLNQFENKVKGVMKQRQNDIKSVEQVEQNTDIIE